MPDVFSLLKSHRSIRCFKEQALEESLVKEIVSCGQHAATSSNIQACTVVHVTEKPLRERLAVLAGNQDHVLSAGAFLVFCADLHRAQGICERAGRDFVAGMTEHFIIATVDVALFAQNCVIAAESVGLGACYIGAVRNHPQEISELLHLPDQVYPVFGLCLGYPDQIIDVKPRLPLSVILKENTYRGSEDKTHIANYDEQMRQYYQNRSDHQKESLWTQEIAALMGKEARPHMRSYLAARGLSKR